MWAAALQANKRDAIEMQWPNVYHRYMKYLTGCADLFYEGYIDVNQFTMQRVSRTYE